ncbi:hypothetical protein KAX02_00115 [candidate division WOR-3 bacterium]|nr:hypothetical protein [candidate division WOR-3 bacterium]
MNRKILLAIAVILIPTILLALPPDSKLNMQLREPYNPGAGTKGEITYKPADWWMIAWIGMGNVTDYMISNTLQGGGPFIRPPDWDYYDGGFPFWSQDVYPDLRGLACEYPAGSNQFYTYASGLWVNALCPVVDAGDTTWVPKSIETAYSSDLGAMSIPEVADIGGNDYSYLGLCFSTQRIRKGTGEGDFLFAQPGSEPKDYQALWPFVDTLINARRPDSSTWVDPENGDVISLEDTYAVAGDYIPAGDATTIWIRDAGPYAGTQVGIRIEERTYCWNYPYNDAYFFINWKIKNMNSYRLKDVYVAHFMDNDIGAGINETDQGAWDDMMGFDRLLNLTYSYDSDGYEPGWTTKAGYVGGIMCESPYDRGLTGVQTWLYGDPIDEDLQDAMRHDYMARTSFMTWSVAQDIRQLASSGPFDLAPFGEPGDEVDFTVAIVVGETLDELRYRARYALTQFENGYLGFSPPPSPSVEIIPADESVYLAWDTSPESYVCPMSGEQTFEGYRVYKSLTGVAGDWEILVDYDFIDSYTKDTVMVKYQKGVSNAQMEFLEFIDGFDQLLTTTVYTIDFDSDNHFSVYNVTEMILYPYRELAEESGGGFCIKENMEADAYETNPGYISGSIIYMDGFYVSISDGEYDPSQPGADIDPNDGDQFVVKGYASEGHGNECGIKRYRVDEDLINGVRYYYSVNSYSRPIPYLAVEELESGMSGKKYWAIPRKEAVDYQFPSQPVIERTGGSGDIRFEAYIANPNEVLDAQYKLRFGTNSPGTDSADFWQLVRMDGDSEIILIDSSTYIDLEATEVIEGLSFQLATVLRPAIDMETVIDEDKTGWIKGSSDCEFIKERVYGEPRNNYHIIFSDTGSYDSYGRKAPFEVWNINRGGPPESFIYSGDSTSIYPPGPGRNAWIMITDTTEGFEWRLRLDAPLDSAFAHPEIGDIYLLKVLIRTTIDDEFTVTTTSKKEKDGYELDDIRVVPNPYYVSAVWDGPSEYERKIYFQGLPSECTIRIFNVAGLLLRKIEHDETIATYFRPDIMGDEKEQGAHAWDLKTNGGYEVISGLYIYQVITPDGKEKVGKFAVVR